MPLLSRKTTLRDADGMPVTMAARPNRVEEISKCKRRTAYLSNGSTVTLTLGSDIRDPHGRRAFGTWYVPGGLTPKYITDGNTLVYWSDHGR